MGVQRITPCVVGAIRDHVRNLAPHWGDNKRRSGGGSRTGNGPGVCFYPPSDIFPAKHLARARVRVTVNRVKLLFIGDIVGQPGRRAVKELVPKLRERHSLDFVIANGENSAGGSGITPKTAEEIFSAGVDVITSGDHLWDQKEVTELLANDKRFLRPLNYPTGTLGHGSGIYESRNTQRATRTPISIAVLNAQGRTFMPVLENPFLAALDEVKKLREHTKIIFVDFHAEATSEKIAFARMLDGQVSAVVGTHTHVQTADEQIFPGGTAFLTDAGFTGPHESVLGREITPVVQRFLTNTPQRFEVAKERVILHGAVIEIDEASGRAVQIHRVSETLA
jgi:metallophosphoesterase (TIGR00282 family)